MSYSLKRSAADKLFHFQVNQANKGTVSTIYINGNITPSVIIIDIAETYNNETNNFLKLYPSLQNIIEHLTQSNLTTYYTNTNILNQPAYNYNLNNEIISTLLHIPDKKVIRVSLYFKNQDPKVILQILVYFLIHVFKLEFDAIRTLFQSNTELFSPYNNALHEIFFNLSIAQSK